VEKRGKKMGEEVEHRGNETQTPYPVDGKRTVRGENGSKLRGLTLVRVEKSKLADGA